MDPKELVPMLAQAALFLVVLSFGLQAHARDVLAAMRDGPLITRGILAVNIVVPAAAVIVCLLLPIDPEVRIGIAVMAISPLAPFVPVKMRKGGTEASQALGLYVALILAAVVLVPLTVALLSALFPANASLDVAALANLVAMTILLPVIIGLAIATWAPNIARVAAKLAMIVGFGAVAILVCLIVYKQGAAMVSLIGDGTLLAIVLIVVAGLVAGHLLGRPDPATSGALAMAAAIRHPGIAALIARENFTDPRVITAVILFLLTSVVVTAIYQRVFGKKEPGAGRPATV